MELYIFFATIKTFPSAGVSHVKCIATSTLDFYTMTSFSVI